MTAQLLIYQSAIPVNQTVHGSFSVDAGTDYRFATEVNSVPVMTVEFPMATSEYPIVFAGNGGALSTVVVLGLRDRENLFVASDGRWTGGYVPAFLRRYPFVYARSDDARHILCIDETYPGVNIHDRGKRLFTDDGALTPYTHDMVSFLNDFEAQSAVTRRFCERIQSLDILEPMHAQGTVGDAGWMLNGFFAIDKARLKALPAETLASLARGDELELIHLHLQSLRTFGAMPRRLAERVGS
jgi:hypothetical protein